MPEIPFRYVFVRQQLVGGADLCSLLAHPALCRVVENDIAPSATIIDHSAELIAAGSPYAHVQFTFPEQIHKASAVIRVSPRKNRLAGNQNSS